MSTEDLTPLQADIKAMIQAYPEKEDRDIAELVFKKNHPDEPYEGKDPSFQYVGKLRKRFDVEAQPPEIFIEAPEIPEVEEELEEGEEPEIPFEEEEFDYPEEITPEPAEPEVEGFTHDDVTFLLVFTFDKFADWSGWEGWRFSTDAQGKLIDKNDRRFAGLTHRMAEKYLPDLLELYFLEFMFCYTAIMVIGGRTSGYLKWRKTRQPITKKVDSTIIDKEQPEKPEIPEEEAAETPTEAESERESERPLPAGALAHGEEELKRRLRRQPK